MRLLSMILSVLSIAAACTASDNRSVQVPSDSVRIAPGPVNGVSIERGGHRLVVYGDPGGTMERADKVLLTHGRRDVIWAGRGLIEGGAESVVPAVEANVFTEAVEFWKGWTTARFHDYKQQSTKVPLMPLRVDRIVHGGDTIRWQDLSIEVIDTPGYTRGAVTYAVDVDGLKYAFVGDLLYGDGQILDLYSLQDQVPEAQIGGYHGYASRMGDLIQSLRKVAEQDPDILVPARGPIVRDPQATIDRLIGRLQAVYANYLSVNAGRWYFRERYDILAKRVLGDPNRVNWMPWATTIEETPPSWMVCIANSRLLLSETGAGWLIDCGSQRIVDEVKKLRDAGRLKSLEGLFITHYHDDHTNSIGALLETFSCPVYVTPLMADILKDPHAYRLPAMTDRPVANPRVVPDGFEMSWREFKLTFYDYPGQTLYHDAMLVERSDGQSLFFLGDSFTPSGFDDYCLLNRNLLHEGAGYFYCVDVLETLPPDCLLVNEHVGPVFRFDKTQLSRMRDALNEQRRLLGEVLPWDEPNYGIDERWARIVPYGQTIHPGQSADVEVRVLNHSDHPHLYAVIPHVPAGLHVEPAQAEATVQPQEEAVLAFKVTAGSAPVFFPAVVTADVAFDGWDLRRWCEALIEIKP